MLLYQLLLYLLNINFSKMHIRLYLHYQAIYLFMMDYQPRYFKTHFNEFLLQIRN